jgi:hypothetical protein
MILPVFTIFPEPEDPLRFSPDELRSFLTTELAGFSAIHKEASTGFIHRYPAIQCKTIKGRLVVIGISQGAGCLWQLTENKALLGTGENVCRITARDQAIRSEPFGITDTVFTYEFLSPWLALNQQNAKKFYELKGKPERDAFMLKLLGAQLTTLAKSLDYRLTAPVTCEAKVRFRRDRIGRENVMVFLGKFRTNLQIPDYFGIGQSIAQGYGTIKRITESSEYDAGDA